MNTATLLTSLAALAVLANCADSTAADGRNLSSVNGSVSASPGQTYESVSTVNGNVRVGRGATASTAKTVNGNLTIDDEATIGKASTVNGSLRIGESVVVSKEVSTVNGDVKLAKRTRVASGVSTVSGSIELTGAEVVGTLTTSNGDIELSDGAVVRGSIHVKGSNNNWGFRDSDPVHVRICASCTVDGTLRFDRPTVLHVAPGAKIGQVIGESVTRR